MVHFCIKIVYLRHTKLERLMVTIREATLHDMSAVAYIHKSIFGDHFIGMLPVPMIRRFYNCFINDEVIFFVSEDERGISGFVMGGESGVLNSCRDMFMKNNFIKLGLSIIITPRIYFMAFERIKGFLKRSDQKKSHLSEQRHFSLLSIGVTEKSKGTGVAQELVQKFEEKLKRSDIGIYSLSVSKNNPRAIRFYEKTGYCFVSENSSSFHYEKTL